MRYRHTFKTDKERDLLIEQHNDLFLIEVQYLKEGNFLVFSEEKPKASLLSTQEELSLQIQQVQKESLITMAALADKHEETLQLKKMNEDLRQTTLIALEGVAILNEEVQQIKKNNEASAN